MHKKLMGALLLLFPLFLSAGVGVPDSICGRKVVYGKSGEVLGWYLPGTPGAVYDHVVKLSAGFLLHAPVEPKTGLPMYFVTCCFKGPDMTPDKDFVARDWMHNPACFFAGSVQSLAVQYYAYSGDDRYIKLIKRMLDYQLEHGSTPATFKWPFVPYASSDPFSVEYQGATRWDGKRGDGLNCIEPDKVGELGYAYLRFFEITGDKKYLEAAICCADALARNVRGIRIAGSDEENSEVLAGKSPWPFRLNASSGDVIDEYCSNVLEPVKLLRELVRIGPRIGISDEKAALYRKASDGAWNWLSGRNGPLRTFIWNGYFEDVEHDPTLSNRVQITPVELAKYLAQNPDRDEMYAVHVPALLYYAVSAFKTQGMDAMNEQLWCYRPMGSHTARFGAACALWYENNGNVWFRDLALRYLNVASYMTHDNGVVSTGPDYPASWFSDGYSDYIRHFLDAIAAVPEWAPAGENHLLRSSSVIQSIYYRKNTIEYVTFDQESTEKLRLIKKPSEIMAGTKKIEEVVDPTDEGWTWSELDKGGVLIIHHKQGNPVTVKLQD